MIDLSFLGLLSIEGPDAERFLQGQLTCDVTLLSDLHPLTLGAHCNPQGRIISLFNLIWYRHQYWLQMPRDLIPKALTALKKYAVFFKVTLTDQSEAFTQAGFLDLPITTFDEEILLLNMPGRTPRYQILGKKSLIKPFQKESADAWKQIDIQSQIPHLYAESSEKFLPHELNLPALKGVSFDKGCYTGQEIIARMEYRGKLKTLLTALTLETPDPLRRGEDISLGRIVDFCQIGYNKYSILLIAPISKEEQKN